MLTFIIKSNVFRMLEEILKKKFENSDTIYRFRLIKN